MPELIYIPSVCPCCGHPTEIKEDPVSGVQTLWCVNPMCPVKGNKSFEHFVCRDAMNIEGISESTLVKLKEAGLIENFADLYHLDKYATEIINMPGFGEKSFLKMYNAIEKSRKVKVANFLYALGIDNIGLATAKLIAKSCKYDFLTMAQLTFDQLMSIEGIGPTIAMSYVQWFADNNNKQILIDLLNEVDFIPEEVSNNNTLGTITIAVHGSLHRIKRTALKDLVESMGGKLVTSVNKSTTYLVTNQTGDTTNKVNAARKYNVPIISEDEFISKFNLPV